MKLTVACTFGRKFKKGDIVEVDAMRFSLIGAYGIQFRVVGAWKEPRWMDAGWFIDERGRQLALIESDDA